MQGVNGPGLHAAEELHAIIGANQAVLTAIDRKVSRQRIYTATFDCNPQKMAEITATGYFHNIELRSFNELLTPLVRCFLSDEFPQNRDNFRRIFENEHTAEQFRTFINKFSAHLILTRASIQEQLVGRLLKLTTLTRIKAVTVNIFPPEGFNRNLLNRIKADSSVLPSLPNYKVPQGLSQKWEKGKQEAKTIWKICIEDIDNFLESFDILTATPTTAIDALYFCQTYQMSMAVLAGVGQAAQLPVGAGLAFIFVPFIMNALRKLCVRYLTKTPAKLPPLLVFSDPNFYRCVAPINNRDQILTDILTAWSQRITPILIGESGCGKTSILFEIARRIHQKLLPGFESSDYKAFGGTATSLISAGGMFGGNGHIERIFKKIASKKEYTILLLDEIQTFTPEQKILLRTYFDDSPQSIRYAVFATTIAGAQAFFNEDDGSLARRFTSISVPDLNAEETKCILHHQARSMQPDFIVHPELITRIVTHANGKFAQSRKILCQVLRKALKKNTLCPSQESYDNKLTELDLVRAEHLRQLALGNQDAILLSANRINQVEQERKALEKKLESEKLIIQEHGRLLAKRAQLTFKICDTSQKILTEFQKHLTSNGENLNQITADTELSYFNQPVLTNKIDDATKEFIYYNSFLKDALSSRIRAFEAEHHLISEITNDFITDNDLLLDPPTPVHDPAQGPIPAPEPVPAVPVD